MRDGIIRWVGDAGQLGCDADEPSGGADVAMALDDASVLDVAHGHFPLKRLSRESAFLCTSRYLMRGALDRVGLNPRWSGFPWREGWYKAPASSGGSGAWRSARTGAVARLEEHAPWLLQFGTFEEFVPGPQWEVNGSVVDGAVTLFDPVIELWTDDGEFVSSSKDAAPMGLAHAARLAASVLRLDWTPFSIELRKLRGKWVVLEVHACLGRAARISGPLHDGGALLRRIEAEVHDAFGRKFPDSTHQHRCR